MKILVKNYRHAKSPLDSSSIVSLCEEDAVLYHEKLKREIKFNKLFLLCNSSGVRFSNQEIAEENQKRIDDIVRKTMKNRGRKKHG